MKGVKEWYKKTNEQWQASAAWLTGVEVVRKRQKTESIPVVSLLSMLLLFPFRGFRYHTDRLSALHTRQACDNCRLTDPHLECRRMRENENFILDYSSPLPYVSRLQRKSFSNAQSIHTS